MMQSVSYPAPQVETITEMRLLIVDDLFEGRKSLKNQKTNEKKRGKNRSQSSENYVIQSTNRTNTIS